MFAAAGLLAGFVGWPAALETLVVGFAADAGTAAGAGEPFLGAMVIAEADREESVSEKIGICVMFCWVTVSNGSMASPRACDGQLCSIRRTDQSHCVARAL